MRWLLFLSRLAFICGLFFLLSLSQLMWNWLPEGSILSTIITIGFFMGSVIVPVICLSYFGAMIFLKRRLREVVPLWLIVANFLFLFLLIFFIFYWNDPYYNQ